MEFEHDFHGHVGPCRMRRLYSDIFVVVYIYKYLCAVIQLTLYCRLQFVCSVWFVSLFVSAFG